MASKTLFIAILVALQIINCKTVNVFTCTSDEDVYQKLSALTAGIVPVIIIKRLSDNPLSDAKKYKDMEKHYSGMLVQSVLVVPANRCGSSDTVFNDGKGKRNYPSLFIVSDGKLMDVKITDVSLPGFILSYGDFDQYKKKGNCGSSLTIKLKKKIDIDTVERAEQARISRAGASARGSTAPESETLAARLAKIQPYVPVEQQNPYKRSYSLVDQGSIPGDKLKRSVSQHEPNRSRDRIAAAVNERPYPQESWTTTYQAPAPAPSRLTSQQAAAWNPTSISSIAPAASTSNIIPLRSSQPLTLTPTPDPWTQRSRNRSGAQSTVRSGVNRPMPSYAYANVERTTQNLLDNMNLDQDEPRYNGRRSHLTPDESSNLRLTLGSIFNNSESTVSSSGNRRETLQLFE